MSFSNLVAEALLHPERRDDCERRMTCKLSASTQMLCHCGSVLDQNTVCVLERKWDDGEASHIVACCPTCRITAETHVVKLGRKADVQGVFTWLTWDAAQVVDLSASIPQKSAVPGLSIVRQPDVIRGTDKYRVVHVHSDRFISKHSSMKSARQMLAQLDLLGDWTVSMTAIKERMSKADQDRVCSLVRYYAS